VAHWLISKKQPTTAQTDSAGPSKHVKPKHPPESLLGTKDSLIVLMSGNEDEQAGEKQKRHVTVNGKKKKIVDVVSS
jgi:hypothetical protein